MEKRWWNTKVRWKPPPTHTQEATTADAANPKKGLRTVKQTTCTGVGERPTQGGVKWQSCSQGGPKTFPIPADRRGEEGQRGEGTGAQDFCTSGPGDPLWKHEPTLHWVLVISRAGQYNMIDNRERDSWSPLGG